jgi:hypothetical protein
MPHKTVRFSHISYQQSTEGKETSVETKSYDGDTSEKNDLIYVLEDYFYPYGKNKAGKKFLKLNPPPTYSSKRRKYLKTIIDENRLRSLKHDLTNLCKLVEESGKVGIVYRGKSMRVTTVQTPYIKQSILPCIRIKLQLLWTMN